MVDQKIQAALNSLAEPVLSRARFDDVLSVTKDLVPDDVIGNELGFSASSVSRWREGVSAPHPSLFETVAEFLR